MTGGAGGRLMTEMSVDDRWGGGLMAEMSVDDRWGGRASDDGDVC